MGVFWILNIIKVPIATCHHVTTFVTHHQLLEGLKEESQIEDNEKKEEVGARSLIRNTRGVEGRVGTPGLGLGRVTSLIHLLEPASNQPQSGYSSHSETPWC
jgi:hypothetical protein